MKMSTFCPAHAHGASLLLLATMFVYSCLGREFVLLNNRILVHKASDKCLTVSEDYKLFLDTCNYDLEEPLIAGVFSVVRHNRGGHLMRWRTQPIPGAIEGCLQALKPKKESVSGVGVGAVVPSDEEDEAEDDEVGKPVVGGRGELRLVGCDARDPTLNWRFAQNDTYNYFLKKFPDGPCVASSESGSVYTLPCDRDDVNQVWRICQDIDRVKCDA